MRHIRHPLMRPFQSDGVSGLVENRVTIEQ